MIVSDLLLEQIDRIKRQFGTTMMDLDRKMLLWQPEKGANTISFILWHVARSWDSYLEFVDQGQDLYTRDNWSQRFSFETEGKGIGGSSMGTGFSEADMLLVKVQPAVLIEYFDAILVRSQTFLVGSTDEKLGQEIIVPWWPRPSTAAGIFSHLLNHSALHIGEAQYIKGLWELKIK
jgi:uncharacterized damage-inducible protein DinB